MKCPICSVFESCRLRYLLLHISRIHGSNQTFSCACPISGCFISFAKYDTLYRHVKKYHSELYNSTSTTTASINISNVDTTSETEAYINNERISDINNEELEEVPSHQSTSVNDNGNNTGSGFNNEIEEDDIIIEEMQIDIENDTVDELYPQNIDNANDDDELDQQNTNNAPVINFIKSIYVTYS